ncbi:MAG: hypothetical protein Q9191_000827 [Dirinaria sp. TL-2023a]
MSTRTPFYITALLCLVGGILAAGPLQRPGVSSNDGIIALPSNSSLTLPAGNLSAAPLPPFPPPDPLAYAVPNSPVVLVFRKYLTQRREATWVQNIINSAASECAQHAPNEPMENRVYTWWDHMDLMVKPAPETHGYRLSWRIWNAALTGIREFINKYEGFTEGVGLRFNFEILVVTVGATIDGQFAVGKGLLQVV